MGQSITDILAQAKPRERVVKVCIRGDLAGEAERLNDELTQVNEDWQPSDMTDVHPGRKLAAQLKAVWEQIREAEVPFTLRYIGDKAYSDLLAANPSDNDNELFGPDFIKALIAACCVDPLMSEAEAIALFETLNQGEQKRLFDAAWDVHNSSEIIPFSLAASALLGILGGEK